MTPETLPEPTADTFEQAIVARAASLPLVDLYRAEGDPVRLELHTAAEKLLDACAAWLRALDAKWDDEIKAAFQHHRMLCGAKKTAAERPEALRARVRKVLAEYDDVEDHIRREREAVAAKALEDAIVREAAALEAAGDPETAQAVLETAEVAVPQVARAVPASSRINYKAEVVNLRQLCKAIVDGTAPESAVLPNMATLNGAARSMREAFRWPGCRLVKERIGVRR